MTQTNPASHPADAPRGNRFAETAHLLQNSPRFRDLRQGYLDQFQPVGPGEIFLVNTLADCDFMKSRLAAADSEVLAILLGTAEGPYPLGAAYQADLTGDNMLREIFRETNTLNRTFFQAYTKLERLQQKRHAGAHQPQKPPQPAADPDTPPTSANGTSASNPTAAAPTVKDDNPQLYAERTSAPSQPPASQNGSALNPTIRTTAPPLPPYFTRVEKQSPELGPCLKDRP